MAGPFSVEGSTPGTPVWGVDASGNTVQSGNMSVAGTMSAPASTVATLTTTGVIQQDSGINSSGSVNVLSTLLIPVDIGATGTGTQIGDTTRDYMCYVSCTGGGAGNTLTIGSNSGGTSATIFANATMTAGTMLPSWRLPAGWYIKYTGTATLGIQFGVSC